MEVISGAPPAEYGDKTSLVINVTTRSGQGVTTPHGGVTASYGPLARQRRFQSRLRRPEVGKFHFGDGLNSGRFLDPPEFAVMHDKGNEENLFDRVDYNFQRGLRPPQLDTRVPGFRIPIRSTSNSTLSTALAYTNPVTGPLSARPTSARKSRPSILRRPGRA